MSIQSEITRINTNIANAYDAVVTMGGTVPQTQNTANLPDAIATLAQTDYIQLVWIEGTGVQYIDTGLTPDDNYIIEISASSHSNDDTPFFGANDTWNSNRLLCYATSSRVYFRGSGSSYIAHDVTSGTPYTIRVSSSSFTVNGANNQPQTSLGAVNTTLRLFSGGGKISKFRLYSAKVWNGNTLVGDYIPALKKSTCDIGVYNKVDNTFLNNSGLGYFRPGIKIAGYSILDYLQSSGAAWFDTGVSGGSKMEYHMLINTLGSKARNYEQYFAGDNSPVTHKVYMNGSTNTSPVLAQQANGVYWSGTSTANLNLYNNADAWHNISFYSDGKLYLDTTLKGTGVNNGWGTLSYYIFNSHSEPTLISSMRLRYLVMKTDGVIQRFYIPMRKESPITSNITFGVYDLVNDTFVPSASNTAFTANARMMIDDGTTSPYYSIPVVVPTPSTKTGSIAEQIDRINENIANAYDVCRQIGRTLPYVQDSELLEPTILDTLSTAIKLYYYLDTTNHILYLRRTPKAGYTDGSASLTGTRAWYRTPVSIRADYIIIEEKIYTNSLTYWFNVISGIRPEPGWTVQATTIIGFNLLVTDGTTSMTHVFGNDAPVHISLPNINTSLVTDFSYMFVRPWGTKTIDVSNFNTSSAVNMTGMFSTCAQVKELDLTSFDTSNVTTMERMFEQCTGLEYLDLSSFDMSNVTNTYAMFNDCSKVQTAYCRTRADKVILDQAVANEGYSWRFTVKQ